MRRRNVSLLIMMLLFTAQAVFSQTKYIIVDQFGYLPEAEKIAVIKDPQTGFDADESYTPGTIYHVVEVSSGDPVFTGVVSAWNGGVTDGSSGDKVWHFDFSSVTDPGTYYILDEERGHRSYEFRIAHNVYNEVLKQAMRTFFYQRVGFAKEAEFAGEGWADGASHMGDLQDPNCRSFFAKDDASTERDVSGGWYDAGDYNKYTSWTANYVMELLKAYIEAPEAWGDDYNIPESGNGLPDILDETIWGIDHLMRLQLPDGSVLSIVGEDGASPPSAATGNSYYGKVNTSATNNVAGALALGSTVYRSFGMDVYADTLLKRAEMAWEWADANPAVLFNNNDDAYNSSGLGSGRMEVGDYERVMIKLKAASYLFEASGDTKYRDHYDANYREANVFKWGAYQWEIINQDVLLYYTTLEDGTTSVQNEIKAEFKSSLINGSDNLAAHRNARDPYMAYMKDYNWGSNQSKSGMGVMMHEIITYELDPAYYDEAYEASLKYVNYINGVNPLAFVYLSNMYDYGAENGVNEFYHTWFTNGSEKWDRVGESTYGPPPGYLTGGPNPYYDWDGCCPSGCGSTSNNAMCYSESITPPKGQPKQKSYKDFNTSWPLNSWAVTENSCGYQTMYIRMLSKFVTSGMDCAGEVGGTAFFDSCGVCAGGNTGITPVLDPKVCELEPDCEGVAGGVAFIDTCGICSGGNTGRTPVLTEDGCFDCMGIYNGGAFIDACENCAGGSSGIEPVTNYDDCLDCNDVFNGSAYLDSCGICAGGNTGVTATLDKDDCDTSIPEGEELTADNFKLYPNPTSGILHISNKLELPFQVQIIDLNGKVVIDTALEGNPDIDVSELAVGYYEVLLKVCNKSFRQQLMKL